MFPPNSQLKNFLEINCNVLVSSQFFRLNGLPGIKLRIASVAGDIRAMTNEPSTTKSDGEMEDSVNWRRNQAGELRWRSRHFIHYLHDSIGYLVRGRLNLG